MSGKKQNPIRYGEYLKIENLIHLQHPITKSEHEHFFIVIHQCYELWFKQILCELNVILKIFRQSFVPGKDLHIIHKKFIRINEILRVAGSQINILETMDPVEFLEFRDSLGPASGFQSLQFKMVEIRCGITLNKRSPQEMAFLTNALTSDELEKLKSFENEGNIQDAFHSWLKRFPFLQKVGFDFCALYNKAFQNLHGQEFPNQSLPVHDAEKMAVIFIQLYRHFPLFHLPHKILMSMMDMSELLSAWKVRHALMAHRMLGGKIGTGGSSGHEFLMKSALEHRLFPSLFNLSGYLLPPEYLPELPTTLKKEFGLMAEA